MHTVAELRSFRKHAEQAGLSEDDISRLIQLIAATPDAGDEIKGTGGCRKVRFAIHGNNKGKSGGVRTITFYSGASMPVFLITVFGKTQKVTLTKAECNELKKLTEALSDAYSRRVAQLSERGATA